MQLYGGLNILSLVTRLVKNPPTMQEKQVLFLDWEDPLERGMATTPVFLPEESHGQRSLVGSSLWGRRESGVTEQLTHSHTHTHTHTNSKYF